MPLQQNIFENVPDGHITGSLWGTVEETKEDEVIPVYLTKPKAKKYDARWLLLWQDEAEKTGVSMLEQAIDGALNLTDYRVRDYLLCKVGIGNFVHFNQSEASRALQIDQANVSRSIKKLVDMGIVLEGPKAGKFRTYQVNPALAFSGGLGNGITARKDIIKQRAGGATIYRFPGSKAAE